MNVRRFLVLAVSLVLGSSSFADPPTVKDLAIREAQACDTNHNGKIDGNEMAGLRAAQAKNPKSYLYLFDLNDNRYLDDSELSKIPLGPPPPKPVVAAKPGAAPKPAPVHHAKRPSNPANHPHGGPR